MHVPHMPEIGSVIHSIVPKNGEGFHNHMSIVNPHLLFM